MLKVLEEIGFEKPTEIQDQTIPVLLEGEHDFIGLAQTGKGKTAAFGLQLLEKIYPRDDATQVLVLAPTRELGQQIAEQLATFSKYLRKVNVLAVYGGAAIYNQIKALRKPQHVIIATPGRLLDLIKRKAVKLDQLKILVLDEADEMLNMGFKEDLDLILSYTPAEKQTWLFSATMPKEIKRIVKKYMDHPVEVSVNTQNEVNVNIEHQFVIVKQSDKTEALTRFLEIDPDMRGLVFCRTRRDTRELAEELMKRSYKADALHGELSQSQRDNVMKRFKSHRLQVLVATDVAARGIDVNDLTHVFHYALPDDNSYYTHRSGRTARAGKKGISIAFINGREGYKISHLERKLGISFKKVLIPKSVDIVDTHVESWCKEILEKKTSGKIDPELFKKAKTSFKDISKEELVAKVLLSEIEKLNVGTSKDLNDPFHRGSHSDRSGGRRDSRDRRGGDRRSGGGDRRSGGRRSGGDDRRSGGNWKDRRGKPESKGRDDRQESKEKKDWSEKPEGGDRSFKKKKKDYTVSGKGKSFGKNRSKGGGRKKPRS